jgi:hypothetical protein
MIGKNYHMNVQSILHHPEKGNIPRMMQDFSVKEVFW